MVRFTAVAVAAAIVLPCSVSAQSPAELHALRGLSPFASLGNSPAGQAALAANLNVTGDIQHGQGTQPPLLPFPRQQAQALQDAFITRNAAQLADGLGTRLAAIWQQHAPVTRGADGKVGYGDLSPTVGRLIGYTLALTAAHSNAGKYFFANATSDGHAPVGPEAMAILVPAAGATDVYGLAYGKPAGSPGGNAFGDPRPFQTLAAVRHFAAADYFGAPSGNAAYLDGPAQPLADSPAFPSGHTTYGYTGALLLALLVPERYAQEIARGAEYGNDRIILGAHYAMDVIAGRTLALHDVAHLLAGDPAYLGLGKPETTITDFPAALAAARHDVAAALQAGCGDTVATCARDDASRFADIAADAAFYQSTQTYDLPAVFPSSGVEDVAKIAPEAGWLLKAAFPALSLAQADAILTETEGPGGGFLDNGSAFGVYSRLDLVRAGLRAAEMTKSSTP